MPKIHQGNSRHKVCDLLPDWGLGQFSEQQVTYQYSGEVEFFRHSGRQCMELEHSRAYDSSTQHIRWPLVKILAPSKIFGNILTFIRPSQPSKVFVTRFLSAEYKPIYSIIDNRVKHYQVYIQSFITE
ncbi:hypothetical protein LguiA_000040 [Lonicera macranthoides]